jgi:hypothetical protein
MKKILYKITGIVVMSSLLLTSSCTKDFQEINTDPNNTINALPQQLLAPALVDMLTYNQIRNRTFNNELMQVTVDMSDSEGKFSVMTTVPAGQIIYGMDGILNSPILKTSLKYQVKE